MAMLLAEDDAACMKASTDCFAISANRWALSFAAVSNFVSVTKDETAELNSRNLSHYCETTIKASRLTWSSSSLVSPNRTWCPVYPPLHRTAGTPHRKCRLIKLFESIYHEGVT